MDMCASLIKNIALQSYSPPPPVGSGAGLKSDDPWPVLAQLSCSWEGPTEPGTTEPKYPGHWDTYELAICRK